MTCICLYNDDNENYLQIERTLSNDFDKFVDDNDIAYDDTVDNDDNDDYTVDLNVLMKQTATKCMFASL